jgi:hypothetical protein
MLLGLASMASATIPDPALSTANAAGTGVIMAAPSGAGDAIGDIGATITVTVVDGSGTPIAGFPFQDIYVDDTDGSISLCQGGSTADANTNASGVTTISGTIGGGGFTINDLAVYISGVQVTGGSPIDIDVNSVDITADLKVDLADLGAFAGDFTGGVYVFRSDFNYNAALDLADVGRFAQFFGDVCP